MNEKSKIVLLSFLFGVVLILPVFNDIFGIWKFERKEENRNFKDDLSIQLNRLDNFPEDCEEFVKDNFSFRSLALESFHRLKYSIFSISPNTKKTIIGRENWFFLAEKELQGVEGRTRFNAAQLDTIQREWRRRKSFLDSKKVKYYWIICPYKHQIYPEYLPPHIYQSPKPKRVEQLKATFESEFPGLLIDPTNALLKAKKKHRIYAQLDNHWNYRAGEIVSNVLLDRLKADFPKEKFPPFSNFTWKDTILKEGIHYATLNIESLFEKMSIPDLKTSHAFKKDPYGFRNVEKFPHQDDYEIRFESKKPKSKLRVLFIRDSFASALIPFISDYFAESLFIFDDWMYYLNENIIESYKPDIVVFLNSETLTDSYLNNGHTR